MRSKSCRQMDYVVTKITPSFMENPGKNLLSPKSRQNIHHTPNRPAKPENTTKSEQNNTLFTMPVFCAGTVAGRTSTVSISNPSSMKSHSIACISLGTPQS